SKWWQRGKIARVLSGRISIAARMDYFEADDKSADLAKEVIAKISEVLKKYPEPPARGPQRPTQRKPQQGFYKKKKPFPKKRK
ncbi:MAG: C/D box methylation guide ribonucleoprotein complex aNOP56 subunit, partial [Candidatus Heimdallarchaeota archaeon]